MLLFSVPLMAFKLQTCCSHVVKTPHHPMRQCIIMPACLCFSCAFIYCSSLQSPFFSAKEQIQEDKSIFSSRKISYSGSCNTSFITYPSLLFTAMKFLDVQIVQRRIKTIHGEFEMKIQDMVRESEIICFKAN